MSSIYAFFGVTVTILLFLVGYIIKLQTTVAQVETKHDTICASHVEKLKNIDDNLKKISELEHRLDLLMGQTEVYFKQIDKFVVNTIHSPIHKERDALMDKMFEESLSLEEAKRLSYLLKELLSEEDDSVKRFAGVLAIARVESIIWKLERLEAKA